MLVVCQEMEVAKTGKGIEEEGGAIFDVTKFQLDYLTTPSGFLDIGIDFGKTDITTRVRSTDELFIIAYPHFNVNGAVPYQALRISLHLIAVIHSCMPCAYESISISVSSLSVM